MTYNQSEEDFIHDIIPNLINMGVRAIIVEFLILENLIYQQLLFVMQQKLQ